MALLIFVFFEVLIVFPQKIEKSRMTEINKLTHPDEQQAEQRMSGVHLVESKSGMKDWELFSASAETFKNKPEWILTVVKVIYFNQNQQEFTVTGDRGFVDTQTKNMVIVGNVKIQSVNGYEFSSKEVFYKSQLRQIQGPHPILMRGPKDEQGEGLHLTGNSMLVFIDQSKMQINDGIHAEKANREGKSFVLTSQTAEFSVKNKSAKFIGVVAMEYGKLKVQGPEAAFNYGSGKDILSSIQVSGGVRVSDEDKYATSESVYLDLLTNKFTFTGKPRVFQNNDEISGDQIVFYEGGKKVKVENLNAKASESGHE